MLHVDTDIDNDISLTSNSFTPGRIMTSSHRTSDSSPLTQFMHTWAHQCSTTPTASDMNDKWPATNWHTSTRPTQPFILSGSIN